MKRFFSLLGLAFLFAGVGAPVQANVTITGTRVIYPADEREVIVKLTNAGKQPALVQSWVDSGDPKLTAATATAPFLILPPITRIEPGKGQSLRLSYTQEPLPSDRESVFWLNVLDIPPLPNQADHNYLQIAYRSRIKLFFRPADLPGDLEQAANGLRWSLVHDNQRVSLRARNDSAFYVSCLSATLVGGAGKRWNSEAGMVAPRATRDFPLLNLANAPPGPLAVHYEWINDYGSATPVETPLPR